MHYIIIGGDAAGMSAAMQIFKHDVHAQITILEAGDTYSYGQCGLPYYIGGQIEDVTDVIARTPKDFQELGMKPHIFTKVTNIYPEKKQVMGLHTRTGETFTYTYDKLLIATGAYPVMPDWPGNHLEQIYTLKTIHDAEAIKRDMVKDVKKVTIIGGGYIGIEMAENFAKRGVHVRMLVRGKALLKILDEDMSAHVLKEANKHGIDVHLDENTECFHGEDTVSQVQTDKGIYDTDLVLVATGVAPNTDFIKETQIKTGEKAAICTNEYMQTNIKYIYAAGDCTTAFHQILEQPVYIPLGTTANKQGRIAGLNMAGNKRPFKGIVGTSIMQFMNITLGKTGLSETEAQQANIPYKTVKIEAENIASYYPNVQPMYVKLVYESITRQLLGAQIIGESGVDKRIDVVVTAMTNEMTIDDLEDLDLAYAPPYNGVWDPLQKAARKSANE